MIEISPTTRNAIPTGSSPTSTTRLRTTNAAPAMPSSSPPSLRGLIGSPSSGAATAAIRIGLRLVMILARPEETVRMPSHVMPW